MQPPQQQVRAVFDDETITVYQAYSAAIAVPAAANDSFVDTPFKLDRMTWIKPSFLWMMYRSGWATKPGQEHVLAIQITRAGFEEALSLACLSHFDPDIYPDHATWTQRTQSSPVRVQWDPERSIALEPLPRRSIQVGLSGPATEHYVNRWIVHITDITTLVHELHQIAPLNPRQVPIETPYPVPPAIAHAIGLSPA
ncbi:MAG: DUF4291 domain-containing protein [Demequinaceae bacterium]|nr:DUF4291 domain-containing protein [Demequinaceae bacterium]